MMPAENSSWVFKPAWHKKYLNWHDLQIPWAAGGVSFKKSWANRERFNCFSLNISQQDDDAGITLNQNRPELKFKVVGTLDDNARGDLNDEMADLCANLPIRVVVKTDRAPTDLASDVAALVQRRCNSRNIA